MDRSLRLFLHDTRKCQGHRVLNQEQGSHTRWGSLYPTRSGRTQKRSWHPQEGHSRVGVRLPSYEADRKQREYGDEEQKPQLGHGGPPSCYSKASYSKRTQQWVSR